MNPKEEKKQIVKEVITPFFINNGFIKKGLKYFYVINHLIVEAWVQTLRYNRNENNDEFRIVIEIYPDNVVPFANMYFGGYHIPENSSHIIIDETTDIENLKITLHNELNAFLLYLEKYKNIENIIGEQRIEIKKIENEILEKNCELKKETQNKNLIEIINNTIKLYEKYIEIKNNWIKIVER